jgi:type II restriction/modification system DNA methylase subunit YeeA
VSSPASAPSSFGIEINPYAAELARVSIWIGEIQWMQRNGFGIARNPILRPLNAVKQCDAVLNEDGTEPEWEAVDVIIGNPPFLGSRKMWNVLGKPYSERLRRRYKGRIPRGGDFVTYWFAKANDVIANGKATAVGLVATNSIRGGASRRILDRIVAKHRVFDAWADEPWIIEGAAVRVSVICFTRHDDASKYPRRLNGEPVHGILPDLTPSRIGVPVDLTRARPLKENLNVAWQGIVPRGPFQISGARARELIRLPANPNGERNVQVLRPYLNAADLTRRPSDTWLVDFDDLTEHEAALFERPFAEVEKRVREARKKAEQADAREQWWKLWRPRNRLRRKLAEINRYLAVPRVGKYQPFSWKDPHILPDNAIVAVAREDDFCFGVLNSRYHQIWCDAVDKSSLEDRPRYTVSVKFDTFPFPEGLTPDMPAEAYLDEPRAQRVAAAARRLNELREAWLNPPDLVVRVPEVVPGYPARILPKDEECAKELKKRTLTKLYNQRPAWLDNIHKELDAAVAAAYGWPVDLSADEILARLFKLNQERAGVRQGLDASRREAVA